MPTKRRKTKAPSSIYSRPASKVASEEVPEAGTTDLAPSSRGRDYPVLYSTELANKITDMYMQGTSLAAIARLEGMPSYQTILRWVKENDECKKLFQGARYSRALHFEDVAIEATQNAQTKEEAITGRLKFDGAVWAAQVNDPGTYAKKTTVSGDASNPVQIVVLTGVPAPMAHQKQAELGADGLIKDVVSEVVESA